jgi:hypothetical protein
MRGQEMFSRNDNPMRLRRISHNCLWQTTPRDDLPLRNMPAPLFIYNAVVAPERSTRVWAGRCCGSRRREARPTAMEHCFKAFRNALFHLGAGSFRVGGDLGNEHPLQNGREM